MGLKNVSQKIKMARSKLIAPQGFLDGLRRAVAALQNICFIDNKLVAGNRRDLQFKRGATVANGVPQVVRNEFLGGHKLA
jgi:hypothetical protein